VDWGSIIGLLLGLGGILVGQLLEDGSVASLIQPAAFVIVVIGTIGAVILQSGLQNFLKGVGMARYVLVRRRDDFEDQRTQIVNWAFLARRDGLLVLDKVVDDVEETFLQYGLRMIVDGVDPARIRDFLNTEIEEYEAKERLAIKIWEAAGGYSPTIGILGAVLGLIQVMKNLSDPSALGSGIAVAFVATIYGVGFANLVFLPIGNRLKEYVSKEVRRREMLLEALYGLAVGENPRMIGERLSIFSQ